MTRPSDASYRDAAALMARNAPYITVQQWATVSRAQDGAFVEVAIWIPEQLAEMCESDVRKTEDGDARAPEC